MLRESRYNTWVDLGDMVAVHNGMSGVLRLLSHDEAIGVRRFVDGDDSSDISPALLRSLVEDRVLTSVDVDELAVLRARFDRARFGGQLGLTVVTSLGCNFDCPYCFEEKHPSKLRPEVSEAIVALVEERLPTAERVSVTWMGGEPLLATESLFSLSEHLIRRCDDAGVPYDAGIITNGWHLDADVAWRLAELRVRSAQVTIDGPPDVHDRYRPHLGGGATFDRVLDNVVTAVDHLAVTLRVNLDRRNIARFEELLVILADRGLAGRIPVTPARLTGVPSNPDAPSASHDHDGFTPAQFAEVEPELWSLLERHGFPPVGVPNPIPTPCTAVRDGTIVVGPEGELWKCWDDIGNEDELVGSLFDRDRVEPSHDKWLAYDPFSDPDCSTCVALPGCMGGCAHHGFHGDRSERCGTFRHNHHERVAEAARRQLGRPDERRSLPRLSACAPQSAPEPVAVPVTLGRRRH